MRKKLIDNGGFTMVEMLCAVVILVMLCLITNTGLSLAMKSYQDMTAESETQLLLNDLSDALADKLRYAIVTFTETKTTNPDGSISISKNMACSLDGVVMNTDGKVENITNSNGKIQVGGKALLSGGAYGNVMPGGDRRYKVTSVSARWDDDLDESTDTDLDEGKTLTFYIHLEIEDTLGKNVSKKADFTVRCLNPVKKEEEP